MVPVRGSADTSIQAHAAQLAEGLGILGVRRAIIVAHSFGARLALALAERDRRMISHLVPVAPAAFRHFRPFEHAALAPRAAPLLAPIWSTTSAGLMDRSWVEAVHRMVFSPGEPTHHWRSSYPWDTVLCVAQMVHEGQDFAEIHPLTPEPDLDVSAIDIATTILAGMADLIVDPISQGRRLAEIVPNARFEPVAGEGHMLHHRRPDISLGAVSRAVSA